MTNSRVFDAIRLAVISPETLTALLTLLLFQYAPEILLVIGEQISNGDSTTVGMMLAFPVGCITMCVTFSYSLMFPREDNGVLKDSGVYGDLIRRVMWSNLICLISVIGVGLIKILSTRLPHLFIGLMYSALTLPATVSVATMFYASLMVRCITEGRSK